MRPAPNIDGLPRLLLLANGVITVLSGLGQVVAPGVTLGVMRVDVTPASKQLFATIGMFMMLFGGQLTQTLLSERPAPIVLLWAGLQKLGACGAVMLGVRRGVFSPLALVVASYDLLNGVLTLWCWRKVRGGSS